MRFLGTKRFGLDGGESTIPALEQIIKRGGQLGVKEIVLGMSHRGRLNVLANVMSKPVSPAPSTNFQGGSAQPSEVQGSGDVKYHLGASSDREFDGVKVHLSLTPNPSHLEAADPVVLGKSRAQAVPAQRCRCARERSAVAYSWRRGVRGARASSRNASQCRVRAASTPAARFILSSTIR
ncbi:MAG: hypothetical protein WDM89_10195 [Rhizomicrobium sp.]